MRRTILLLATLMLFTYSYADDYTTIKSNYKKMLLFEGDEYLTKNLLELPKEDYFSDQVVVELTDRYPITNIRQLITNLNANSTWKDIDYTSNDRSNWKPKIHVERILLMSRAYNTNSHQFYKSEELLKIIHSTLQYWIEAKHICPNWWYNEIGTPKMLGMISILMEEQLSTQEKDALIEIMKRAKIKMTGQNKVWLSGIVLVRALLENDKALVKEARDSIVSEITIGKGTNEGIKTDWSFHQHGAQQQFGNYGASYISNMSFWGKVFSGTSFALNQHQLDLLKNLLVNGFDRILWKGYMDVNGLGRQVFKQAQRHKAFSTAFAANTLAGIDPRNKEQYNKLIESNITETGKPSENIGLYHFWLSDQTVNRTPTWMTSVKMSSNRVIGAEGGNGDNKMGYYTADGATYTYISGDEYSNIMPNWNWRRIPGITAHQTDLPYKQLKWLGGKNKADFVGNVNNGEYGLTVMDFNRDELKAKKAWVFTPKYILCSGTDISSDSLCSVNTSIEQSLQKSDLLHLDKGKWKAIKKEKEFTGEQRFFHNNIGYIVLSGDKILASAEKRTNSWNNVMDTYPENYTTTNNVVSIWIDHGVQPKSAKYRYLIIPNVTEDKVRNFDLDFISKSGFDMTEMSKDQLFYFSEKAFSYKKVGKSKSVSLESKEGGLFMMLKENKKWVLYYSDPTQKLERVRITFNGQTKVLVLPEGELSGTSVKF